MKDVLVVEDEASIARIIQHTLEREGFVVTVAADGEAALAEAGAYHPDLIILDLLLPKRDGWSVARALKAAPDTASIPILILSIVADRERGLAAGATDYMTKPFAMSELLERVRRLTT